jgi:hypothetical protein
LIGQFGVGFGLLLAPLIVRPFALNVPEETSDHRLHVSIGSFSVPGSASNITAHHNPFVFHREDLRIQYPFWITGVLLVLSSLPYFVTWRLHPVTKPHPSRESAGVVLDQGKNKLSNDTIGSDRSQSFISSKELEEIEDIRNSRNYIIWKHSAIGLLCLYVLIYHGIELAFGHYLTSFAVASDLHLTKQRGMEITSAYWAAFTFGRLVTATYIGYIGADGNMLLNSCAILIASVIMLPLGYRYESCLWTGAIFMGMGCSTIWPSSFGYLELYFPMTSRIGAFIIICETSGEFIFPTLISRFMNDYPNILLIVTFSCSCSMAVIFPIIVIIGKFKLRIKISGN